MAYIKKSNLKTLLGSHLEKIFSQDDFTHIKSKSLLIKKFSNGYSMIDYRIIDSYDFKKDTVIWQIDVNFYVCFDVIINLLHQFEHRAKKDLKYDWTYGVNMKKYIDDELLIKVYEPNIDSKLTDLVNKISDKYCSFFLEYKKLKSISSKILDYNIDDLLEGKISKNIPELMRDMILHKYRNSNNFESIFQKFKKFVKKRIEFNDFTASHYSPLLDDYYEKLISYEIANNITLS